MKLRVEINGDTLQFECNQLNLLSGGCLKWLVARKSRQQFGNCEEPLPGCLGSAHNALPD